MDFLMHWEDKDRLAEQTDGLLSNMEAIIEGRNAELAAVRDQVKNYKALIKILVNNLYRVSGSGNHILLTDLVDLPKDSPGWKLLCHVMREPM
jgi:hypothetical protein